MDVTSFSGDFRFLSNFYPSKINVEGDWYPTVEHAYQASKTINLVERKVFQDKDLKAGRAKQLGTKVTLRANWEKIKLPLMHNLIKYKFSHSKRLQNKLLQIDGRIVEGNYWGDTFWGQCPLGVGENKLGIILMAIRDEIKELDRK